MFLDEFQKSFWLNLCDQGSPEMEFVQMAWPAHHIELAGGEKNLEDAPAMKHQMLFTDDCIPVSRFLEEIYYCRHPHENEIYNFDFPAVVGVIRLQR